MRNVKRLGAVAVALVLAVALAAPTQATEITVGQFVQQLARAKNLNATDAKIAADSLAAVGVVLPPLNYGAVLTEGDVALIARSAGLNVRTATPEAAFNADKSSRFFSSFSGELEDDNGIRSRKSYRKSEPGPEDETPDGEAEAPDGKGKGKGKGKNGRTPSEPD